MTKSEKPVDVNPPQKKPRGRPKKPVDPNPPPKRPVGRPKKVRKDHPVIAQELDAILAASTKAPKSEEETERKRAFRAEARKYDMVMLKNLAHIALYGDHVASRVKASEAILHMGHGRPSTVQSELPTTNLVPNFTIMFGRPEQMTIQQTPQITLAPYKETDEPTDDE